MLDWLRPRPFGENELDTERESYCSGSWSALRLLSLWWRLPPLPWMLLWLTERSLVP